MPKTPADPTRRDVVKLAGAATVAAASTRRAEGAPAIQTVRAANNQLQYALIGSGSRGQYHMKHAKGIDTGRCVAVCDTVEENALKGAKEIGSNPKVYKDYRELLANKDVDAVLIATPLFMHYPVTRDALLAGKHVFCEKSLVFKPEEVHGLRALSKERPKQVLQTGLQRRYSAFYDAAAQMIQKGMLGDVTHVYAQWHRGPMGAWRMKGDAKNPKDRLATWRLFREYSGGLVAELASHQIDVADRMFGATPEFVVGVGGLDYMKDGRDVYDNIQLIFKYPKGQKLTYTSISTNSHLPLFGGARTQFGEMIMGTHGAIHITVGTDNEPALGIWYPEANPPQTGPAGEKKAQPAGASLAGTGKGGKGLPILLNRDQVSDQDGFIAKELKFARRWLYSKGVMLPEEDRNPVDVQLESFFSDCKTGAHPKADLEIGLADSTAVILANLALDEGRRVFFNEIDKMGKGPEPKARKA
ncbi:MAG: Gfo/Idh/MocA family oxidoreductase [Acidobacteria bacterium]|nr:Gfo/Idh/MocA family oxidoreductase [Acidobacteriota bacterium]